MCCGSQATTFFGAVTKKKMSPTSQYCYVHSMFCSQNHDSTALST